MNSQNMDFVRPLQHLVYRCVSVVLQLIRGAAFAVLMVLGSSAQGAEFARTADSWLDEEPEFLRVDEAFVLSTEVAADGAILAYWEIADGYYLYRHRFNFQNRVSAEDLNSPLVLSAAEIAPGKRKVDEFFGDVEVYYHQAQARIPVHSGAMVFPHLLSLIVSNMN